MKELFLMNDYYQLCEELFLGWKEEDKKLKDDWLLFQLNLLEVSVDDMKMSIIDKQNGRIRKTLFRANNKYLLITSN